jgi:hypothetical protein
MSFVLLRDRLTKLRFLVLAHRAVSSTRLIITGIGDACSVKILKHEPSRPGVLGARGLTHRNNPDEPYRVSSISGGPLMREGARGAFPERGPLPRLTLPDACRASRDSGVTPARHHVLLVRTEGHRLFRQYKNLDSVAALQAVYGDNGYIF